MYSYLLVLIVGVVIVQIMVLFLVAARRLPILLVMMTASRISRRCSIITRFKEIPITSSAAYVWNNSFGSS
jgi:hypothetical protein